MTLNNLHFMQNEWETWIKMFNNKLSVLFPRGGYFVCHLYQDVFDRHVSKLHIESEVIINYLMLKMIFTDDISPTWSTESMRIGRILNWCEFVPIRGAQDDKSRLVHWQIVELLWSGADLSDFWLLCFSSFSLTSFFLPWNDGRYVRLEILQTPPKNAVSHLLHPSSISFADQL